MMKNRASQNKGHYVSLVETVAWNSTQNQIAQPVFSSQGLRFVLEKNLIPTSGNRRNILITKARKINMTK